MLHNIWNDIRKGENIDLYVTIIAAGILAVLNLLGLASTALVSSLTLAVLALITIAILGNRYRLEDIVEQTSSTGIGGISEEFPAGFIAALENAQELLSTGIHQSGTMTKYYSLFEQKLKRGDKLRFLVVDPEGAACHMAAMRYAGKVTAEHERIRILSTLDSLCELKKLAPESLEIRTIDYLLEYGAFLLRPAETVYVERYTFKARGGGRKPKIVYQRRDDDWHDLISKEIESLWESGQPWVC